MAIESPNMLMQTLYGLVVGPPIWVWPLLCVLLFIGWKASKPRQTTVMFYYLLPLLGVMTVQSVSSLPHVGPAWMAFGTAYFVAAIGFYRLQSRWVLKRSNGVLDLAGEWVTLATMMVVFWANFAKGVVLDVAPDLYQHTLFNVVFAVVVGIAGGSFLGRSARIVSMPDTDDAPNVSANLV
ncbi:MAG: hypothetical protein ACI9PY_002733 [Ascidiaceihabitans sp.]|jgi:hypothetical protein